MTLQKKIGAITDLKKALPNAKSIIESHCLNFPGGQALVLYLYQLENGEPSSALVLFETKGTVLTPLFFQDGMGYELYPFYVKEAKKLKSYFLFAFDFDSDGKQEIFITAGAGMNSKDLQIFEIGAKGFKQLSFSQINNKVSQASSNYISGHPENEIVLMFLPKSSTPNPIFEVYFQESEHLDVKKLQNPMRYIKSK
jgi:hypothetical protein